MIYVPNSVLSTRAESITLYVDSAPMYCVDILEIIGRRYVCETLVPEDCFSVYNLCKTFFLKNTELAVTCCKLDVYYIYLIYLVYYTQVCTVYYKLSNKLK